MVAGLEALDLVLAHEPVDELKQLARTHLAEGGSLPLHRALSHVILERIAANDGPKLSMV
ncbi:MAG: hypothetical protein AAGI34_13730 [Pseudomonadota bacterium]